MLKKKIFLILLILLVIIIKPLYPKTMESIQHRGVIVHFEGTLQNIAKEVERVYPVVKAELEKTLGFRVGFIPTVMIIKDTKTFQKIAGSKFVVAIAVSRNNFIIIDNSRMNVHPFTLRVTLKHELCHLILHHHIENSNLPRWLNEGISQWVSGGIAEIITGGGKKSLKEAVLSDRLIRISALTRGFPADRKAMLLAYEESKSIVEYIIKEFGTGAVLQVLGHLKAGDGIDIAIQKGLSIPIEELEKRWHISLRKRITWFAYFSTNIYTILFSFAALITVYGFIRLLQKKRAYRDEDEDEDEEGDRADRYVP